MKSHKTKIQIRFSDCDMLGHINNAKFATYMEMARVQYVDDAIEPSREWTETGILLASITIDFAIPIYLTDDLTIETTIISIGNKSLKMEYVFVCSTEKGDVVKAKGSTVLVFYHYIEKTTIQVPQLWRDKINLFQGSDL
ncbi:MAG: thioesterase family protein [Bacteroidia bacterium]